MSEPLHDRGEMEQLVKGGLASKLTSTPRWLQVSGALFGVALLVAAIVTVIVQFDVIREALDKADDAPLWMFIALPIAVLANISGTGVMFLVLYRRYGHVGFVEMQAVMASATMFNFLPLRPGLPGRVAYHKVANKIRVRDSVRIMIDASVLSLLVALYDALGAWVFGLVDGGSTYLPWYLAALPLACVVGIAVFPKQHVMRYWSEAFLVRALEMLVWMARYMLAFRIIGVELDFGNALIFACVSSFASMIPFVSNGLGVREWAIAFLAPALAGQIMEIGLTAEIVNRAAEIATVLVAGVPATLYLAARHR